jgi:hypothetical protein
MSLWSERPYEMDRYYILLHEAEQSRLVRQALGERQKQHKVWYKLMCWLGSRLSFWGKRLQERYEFALTDYSSVSRESGGESISKVAFR